MKAEKVRENPENLRKLHILYKELKIKDII